MIRNFNTRFIASLGLSLVVAITTPGALWAESDATIATLNDKQITESDITFAESHLGAQFGQLPESERRAAVLSALLDLKLLADQAVKEGLDQTKEFTQQATFLRDQSLYNAFITKKMSDSITDDEVQARYQQEIAKITMPEELRARHILVETEEEAKEIIKELDEGASFEDIAKEKSKDGAASNGGDLGYFSKGQMVAEFEAVAYTIEPGNYGKEPVKTQFGWHVIKVEDKRPLTPPTLDQVKDQIRSVIVGEKYLKTLAELRSQANIEIPDEELKTSVDKIYEQQSAVTEEAPQ